MRLQRLEAKRGQRRPCDRDADHVGRSRRHLHAQNKTGQCRQQKGRPQATVRRRQDQGGDLDPQPGDGKHADNDRGAQDDGRDERHLPRGTDQCDLGPARGTPQVDAHVGARKQQHRPRDDRQARGILRRITGPEHRPQQNRKGHHEEGGGDQDLPPRGLLVGWQSPQVQPACIGIDPEPDHREVQKCRQQGSHDDLRVGRAGQFDHDESPSPHQRWHDLAARRGDSLHRSGDPAWISHADHCRDGHRTCRCDIGRGRSRDRPEQRRGDDGDLARAAPQPARGRGGKVHEPLPCLARVQDRAEDDEDCHDAHRDTRQLPKDSAFRQGQRPHQAGGRQRCVPELARDMLTESCIEQRQPCDDGQRPADRTTRGLQHGQQQDATDRVLEPPLDEAILVGKSIGVQCNPDGRCHPRDCQDDAKGRYPARGTLVSEQEDPWQDQRHMQRPGHQVGHQPRKNQPQMKGDEQKRGGQHDCPPCHGTGHRAHCATATPASW